MGWKQISEISIENFSDEMKDELYPIVSWFDLDSKKLDRNQLIHLFKVTQEIVKYKGEQVETLLAELDELAEKQGLEKAKTHKQYKDRSSVSSTEYENLREDNERLRSITFEQEQEIEKLKKDNAKLSYEINHLEKQLEATIRNIHDDDGGSSSDQSTFEIQSTPEYKAMVESLQKKNKHISKLLTDIEIVEKENKILREKLENLKDQLTEATTNMTEVTQEITALKLTNQHQAEKIDLVQQQNSALRKQIEELIKQKEERDLQIDEFSEALDRRIDEWKCILEQKNDEIEQLKIKCNKINNGTSSSSITPYLDRQVVELLEKIDERDNKIDELQKQLEEATREMNETVQRIEQLKITDDHRNNKNSNETKIINQLKLQLNDANERAETLRSSLQNAEEDAKVKDEKISELIEQVQKYESGEFGLAEAVASINELKKRIAVRDKEIYMLVQSLNKLKTETEQLEEQNLLLRQKCGLSDSPLRTDGIAARQRKQKQLITKMQTQMARLKEEKLEQKLTIRNLNETIEKLMKQINEMGGQTNIVVPQNMIVDIYNDETTTTTLLDECHNEKLQELVIENEALRKGLHEVLNSIHEQTGQTIIEVKSQILERLIKILDVRNVAGWYTPAMRLQAELHSLQGGNAELREQLKSARIEIQDSNEQLQKAKIETEILKSQLSKSSADMEFQMPDDNTMKNIEFSEDAFSSARTISKLQPDFSDILNEYNLEKEKNKELIENMEKLENQCKNFSEQINELQQQNEIYEKQLDELKKLLTDDNEQNKKIYENLDLIAQLVISQRKYNYLENREIRLNDEMKQMKENELKLKTTTKNQLIDLNEKLEKLEIENDFLKKSIDEMIPQIKYSTLEKQLLDITLKYRQLVEEINNNNNNNNTEQNFNDGLNKEIELLSSEKNEIYNQVIQLKERNLKLVERLKLYEPQFQSIDNQNEESSINHKLAEIEMKYISETQRTNYFQNLYSIQKEQIVNMEKLQKDLHAEINMLKIKNTELQLNLMDTQNQIITQIPDDLYHECLQQNNQLKKQLEILQLQNDTLKKQFIVCRDEIETYKHWKYGNEQELISLKHQIVDLQATSDDKAIIAKLYFDIEMLRKIEIEYKQRIDILEEEKSMLFKQGDSITNDVAVELKKNIENERKIINELNIKIRNLKNIIFSLRHQYLGSVPLIIIESYVNKLKQIKDEKKEISEKLETIKEIENEMRTTKEELFTKLQLTENLTQQLLDTENRNFILKISDWYQEKCTLVVNELKSRRNYEFKELQFQQALTKIHEQNDEIVKLEEQLIRQTDYTNILESPQQQLQHQKIPIPAPRKTLTSEISIQTIHNQIQDNETNTDNDEQQEQLNEKIKQLAESHAKILELQKEVHNLRKDLVLKQEEILTNRTPERKLSVNEVDEVDDDQIKSMKGVIINLQQLINERDETIRTYQTQMKELKDEHSRAADRMQNEVQKLEAALIDKQQLLKEKEMIDSETNTSLPLNNADLNGATDVQQKAMGYYIRQVHTLETHIGELHTALHVLDTQLTSSREESIRWRTLADDRLYTMDQLRSRLEEQHQNELATYKKEAERWRNEVDVLTMELSKVRLEVKEDDINSTNIVHQKNTEINELKQKITELEKKLQKASDKSKNEISLENAKKQLKEDYETLKKQFETIKNKEKEAREEIRQLRGQLINRPIITGGRSDRSSARVTARETRLQKKISALEEELDETRAKLDHEIAINEMRKTRNIEGLALWDKQKRWQQTAEKLKEKLRQKIDEYEKLQQSYVMSKNIVNRLEREKNTLELRLKSVRGSQIFIEDNRVEILENENLKLRNEIETLQKKLDVCQRHAGSLGAAMLEEKLEAQERKIAILELAAKPQGNVTAEIERLTNENSALHKENIRLEAKNLELKLDLEKLAADTPRLRDQVEHLQRYVDILRVEKEQLLTTNGSTAASTSTTIVQNKKIVDLEKTLLVMKRVIEKLQTENKRLLSTKPQINKDRKDCEERLKSELYRIRKQYKESLEKITILEQELYDAKKHIKMLEESMMPEKPEMNSYEVDELKLQLKQKNELLDKVKILLHRAAAKEKALDEQVKSLKMLIPTENSTNNSEEASDENISPQNES